MNTLSSHLTTLAGNLKGDLRFDDITTTIYSTDASVYKEKPIAVTWPRNTDDIKKILGFAVKTGLSVTARAAGTSLAGQVVSGGIIIDISRYMNKILEINADEMWARVEPGVILDELNLKLKEYGLFFGPETSTSNRCNIGGMVGNNACGSHSIIYGSTREHTIAVKAVLSDGSEVDFGPLSNEEFYSKCKINSLEGKIYSNISEILGNALNQKIIREEYPDHEIPRRNTGYALDILMGSEVFTKESSEKFNFCKLLAGSEGTLAIITEIKLNLVPLPPKNKALVCIHLKNKYDIFETNIIALKFNPSAVELMDNKILELTKNTISQRVNRFFIDGNPEAVVIVEFARDSEKETDTVIQKMIETLKSSGYGYAYPVIKGNDITKVWNLRKAGLGVLSNMKGDARPVSLIEDTAINVQHLHDYIKDVEKMLATYHKEMVIHAHIGTGEIHIRPILNLKDPKDVDTFRKVGLESAKLVKRYKGSMSGEHGDGRLRGEFIRIILGEHNYNLLREVKRCWDPKGILNPGKITDTPPMNSNLRYVPGKDIPDINTIYDFSSTGGILRASEKCNGSGDCRKSVLTGGLMCPSYMATGDEDKTTRARANLVREYMSMEGDPWDHKEIYDILDLCLSCKGCKSECPSSVDIAKIKSEFLQHWYDKHGIPLRTKLIAYITVFNKIGSLVPPAYNFLIKNKLVSFVIKKVAGFSLKRSIPSLHKITLKNWIKTNLSLINPESPVGSVCLFVDEFSDYNDTEIGITTIKLLTSLNYKIVVANHKVSARTFLSKGLVRSAQKIIKNNIMILSSVISSDCPLVGIEPSAILGFRDEYPELAGNELKEQAIILSKNCFTIDEFIAREFRSGKIDSKMFTTEKLDIKLHAHCQQKAISSSNETINMLSIPENYSVTEIPSGCCGMAGSFGYEKEHFELSNKIGELVLFPEVRNSDESVIIAAPGTSCRHHIKDGTGKIALHPAEILFRALKQE